MYRAKSKGGLGCPDLWKYFLASRLIQLAKWHTSPTSTPWLQFERVSVLFHTTSRVSSGHALFPLKALLLGILSQSLYLWSLYKVKFKLLSSPPHLAFFLGEPQFPPAFNTGLEFSSWTWQGLVTLDSLLQDSSFCSPTTEFCLLQIWILQILANTTLFF